MERAALIEILADMIQIRADRIAQVKRPHPVRVAIDGVDGVGKTTLANELAGPLQRRGVSVIRASIDGFHNPRSVRHRPGRGSPEGFFQDSFNYKELTAALLEPVGPGGSRLYRRAVFDYRTDSEVAAPVETAAPNSVLLFDGIFLCARNWRRTGTSAFFFTLRSRSRSGAWPAGTADRRTFMPLKTAGMWKGRSCILRPATRKERRRLWSTTRVWSPRRSPLA